MELGGTYSDARLIELVRSRESLFDRTRPDYKDEAVKAAAWESIAQALDMPTEDCQTRWVRLRERFGRELRLRKPGVIDVAGVSRRPWPLFQQMLWLRRFIQPRNRFPNLNNASRILATTSGSDHGGSVSIASGLQYENQAGSGSGGPLWAPLWVADDNSASTDTPDQPTTKTSLTGDEEEMLEGEREAEDRLGGGGAQEDPLNDAHWGPDVFYGHDKVPREDALDASLAASLCSVSVALSGLAKRIQDERRKECHCRCNLGLDNAETFGRSVGALVHALPRNRRGLVKARIMALLAAETASAAEELSNAPSNLDRDSDSGTHPSELVETTNVKPHPYSMS